MPYNLTEEELNESHSWYPKAEQLVRLGLLPVTQLPYIKRALLAVHTDAFLPSIVRRPFYNFIGKLLELGLGDKTIFRLIRNKVAIDRNKAANNRYVPEEVHMDEKTDLQELSGKTLHSYVKKALVQRSDADFNAGRLAKEKNPNQDRPIVSDTKKNGGLGDKASANKMVRTSEKRGAGIVAAVGKMAKKIREEMELEEGNKENKAKKNAETIKLGQGLFPRAIRKPARTTKKTDYVKRLGREHQQGVTEGIENPNSSGQGHDASHESHPYHGTVTSHGFKYSHSTPITHTSGKKYTHHTYARGERKVGVNDHNSSWESKRSSASGHIRTGRDAASLDKHLKGVKESVDENVFLLGEETTLGEAKLAFKKLLRPNFYKDEKHKRNETETGKIVAKASSKAQVTEAKEKPEIHHETYSGAVAHAHEHIKKATGLHFHENDHMFIPRKPAAGETNHLRFRLHKDGKPTNKHAHVQVYNRDHPSRPGEHHKAYELNFYHDRGKAKVEESVDLGEEDKRYAPKKLDKWSKFSAKKITEWVRDADERAGDREDREFKKRQAEYNKKQADKHVARAAREMERKNPGAQKDLFASYLATAGIELTEKQMDALLEYNKDAVDKSISSSNRSGRKIGKKEGDLIHRLLKGRTTPEKKETEEKKIDESLLSAVSGADAKKPLASKKPTDNKTGGNPANMPKTGTPAAKYGRTQKTYVAKESVDMSEDIDYKKTPMGMLQTLASMVKTKKHAGGKISPNDRLQATKARNELRRRKYYGKLNADIGAYLETLGIELNEEQKKELKKKMIKINTKKPIEHAIHDVGPGGKKTLASKSAGWKESLDESYQLRFDEALKEFGVENFADLDAAKAKEFLAHVDTQLEERKVMSYAEIQAQKRSNKNPTDSQKLYRDEKAKNGKVKEVDAALKSTASEIDSTKGSLSWLPPKKKK